MDEGTECWNIICNNKTNDDDGDGDGDVDFDIRCH